MTWGGDGGGGWWLLLLMGETELRDIRGREPREPGVRYEYLESEETTEVERER